MGIFHCYIAPEMWDENRYYARKFPTPTIYIFRHQKTDSQTLGLVTAWNGFEAYQCRSLELPWKDNEVRVSCIPAGEYDCVKHTSPKFGECFWVKDVPNRSEILIHPANYVSQLLGCVAMGKKHIDINGDHLEDVTNSKDTIKELLGHMPEKCKLIIK